MLISKDIDKKKSALEEEKSLIDERLQMRKSAADEAAKYEQLAEYQRQYALISMDSTRTKDATELMKKITDLQEELAWDAADKEAEASKQAIDDQITAYDEFQSVGAEDLELLLKDANNFSDEVSSVLEKSFDDMMQWLSSNVEEFSFSLGEMQQQMLDSWEDTFRQLHGITGQGFEDLFGLERTYGEIPSVLETKEDYLKRMTGSDQYFNAISDEERFQLLYGWSTAYDDYLAAQPHDADYSHDDDFTSLGTNSNTSSGNKLVGKYKYSYDAQGYKGSKDGYATEAEAKTAASDSIVSALNKYVIELSARGYNPDTIGIMRRNLNAALVASLKVSKYANGGIVDYTGPAWVDGTPTKPEAFLSSADTELLRAMLDAAAFVKSPYVTNIDPSLFTQGDTTNVGDISVVINEANISDELDIEHVAARVGEEIAKSIGRSGFNTSTYAF